MNPISVFPVLLDAALPPQGILASGGIWVVLPVLVVAVAVGVLIRVLRRK